MVMALTASAPGERAIKRRPVHAEYLRYLAHRAALALDERAGMVQLCGAEPRRRPELHAPPLGRLTASPGALDNQAAYI